MDMLINALGAHENFQRHLYGLVSWMLSKPPITFSSICERLTREVRYFSYGEVTRIQIYSECSLISKPLLGHV